MAAVLLVVLPAIALMAPPRAAAQRPPGARLNVRVGPLATPAEARSVAEALAAEGIEHASLPAAADGRIELSVGVFTVSENAERMAARIEVLGIGPVRIVDLGGGSRQEPPAETGTPPSPTPTVPTAAGPFEVRYGWYESREQALPAYRELEAAGFGPTLLEFSSSGGATLGLGVFADWAGAESRMVAMAAAGYPAVRIVELSQAEAEARTGGVRSADADRAAPPAPEPAEQLTPAPTPAFEPAPDVEPTAPPTPLAATLGTPPAVEPAAASYRMSLAAAIAYATDSSPELAGDALQVELSDADVGKAWSLVQPKVFFQHQSARTDPDTVEYYNRLPDGANLLLSELGLPPTVPPFLFEESHHTQVLVSQPLFASGANRFRIQGARAHRDATRSQQADSRADVLMRVHQGFFNLMRQAEVVALRQDSLARAERSLESVQRRFSLGLVPRAEVLRWQVQVSGERVLLIQAQNVYEVGLEQFKQLIGYSPTAPLELLFPPEEQVAAVMDEGVALLERNASSVDDGWLEAHPAIAAARRDADAARLARRATGSDFWPTLDLDGSVGYLQNDTLDLDEFMQWSARLRLSVPLWDGGIRVANRAEARTKEELAELQLRVVRDDLYVQDRSVIADLRADLAALENARAAVAQARETMDSVTNKAELGLVDYIQRIDAQVILTQSEVAETAARYQFIIDLSRWWRIRDPDRLHTGASP